MIEYRPDVIDVDYDYRFFSPEDWLQNYFRCRDLGYDAPLPKTRGEFLIAKSHGILQESWLPDRQTLALWGLPHWWGREVEPWGDLAIARFMKTLNSNDDFAAAVRERLLEVHRATS